jgi:hypothetical protein
MSTCGVTYLGGPATINFISVSIDLQDAGNLQVHLNYRLSFPLNEFFLTTIWGHSIGSPVACRDLSDEVLPFVSDDFDDTPFTSSTAEVTFVA